MELPPDASRIQKLIWNHTWAVIIIGFILSLGGLLSLIGIPMFIGGIVVSIKKKRK